MAADLEIFTTGMHEEVLEFVWKIDKFFLIQMDNFFVDQQSIEVEVGKETKHRSKWQVRVQTTAGNKHCADVVFILLSTTDTNQCVPIKINWEHVMLDGSSTGLQKLQQLVSIKEEARLVKCIGIGNPNEEGWRPYLDKSGFIVMKIKIAVLHRTEERCLQNEVINTVESFNKGSAKKLWKILASLMSNCDSSDVKIVCSDGKELTAHKNILSANSPVFMTMLDSNAEFSGTITVDNVSSKTMEILLHYFYTGELKQGWCHPDNILVFTYAAGKYELKEILDLLNNVLGKLSDSSCNMRLLSLVRKFQLEKAEANLTKQIVDLASAAKTSDDLFGIFGTSEFVYEDPNVSNRALPAC